MVNGSRFQKQIILVYGFKGLSYPIDKQTSDLFKVLTIFLFFPCNKISYPGHVLTSGTTVALLSSIKRLLNMDG